MSETRRRFVQGAVAATGSLAAANWLSLRSYAASCSSETRLLGFGAYNDTGRGVITYSTAIPYWKLGDCELRKVVIALAKGRGTFDAEVATKFTHNKDIWHFKLRVATGNPQAPETQTELFVKSWDGPPMSERDQPRFHPWHVDFTYNADLNGAFAEATSCC